MRVVQERNSANTPHVAAYTRGIDLSGTFERAGGFGGSLARSHQYSSGNLTKLCPCTMRCTGGGANVTTKNTIDRL